MSLSRLLRPFAIVLWALLLARPGWVLSAEDVIAVHVVSARAGVVATLSRDEAEQLFLGRRTTLADGTPVTLIDLPAGPVRDRLYRVLAGKNPIQTRAYWSRQVFTGRAQPPREAESLEQAGNWIATIPGAIGYLPAALIDPRLQSLIHLP